MAHFNAVEQYSTSVVAGQITALVPVRRSDAAPHRNEVFGCVLPLRVSLRPGREVALLLAGFGLNGRNVQAVEGQSGFDAIAEIRTGGHV